MYKTILIAASLTLSSWTLAAESNDMYVGASYNSVSIDFNSATVDEADAIGLLLGIEFRNNLAFEAEYYNSGKANMDYKVGAIQSANIKSQGLGAYAVYRSPGQVYFKGRFGIASNIVDIVDIQCSGSLCINSLFDSGTGFALGVGGGFEISKEFKLEAEYKLLNKDITALGLGLIYEL